MAVIGVVWESVPGAKFYEVGLKYVDEAEPIVYTSLPEPRCVADVSERDTTPSKWVITVTPYDSDSDGVVTKTFPSFVAVPVMSRVLELAPIFTSQSELTFKVKPYEDGSVPTYTHFDAIENVTTNGVYDAVSGLVSFPIDPGRSGGFFVINETVKEGLDFQHVTQITDMIFSDIRSKEVAFRLDIDFNDVLMVDWGDGTVEHYGQGENMEVRHIYSELPASDVQIHFTIAYRNAFSFLGMRGIGKIVKWVAGRGYAGSLHFRDWDFNEVSVLEYVPDHLPTGITSMNDMFAGCATLNDPNIAKWDVSDIEDMSYTFSACYAMDQDLSGWCVAKIMDLPDDFIPELLDSKMPVWGTCPNK